MIKALQEKLLFPNIQKVGWLRKTILHDQGAMLNEMKEDLVQAYMLFAVMINVTHATLSRSSRSLLCASTNGVNIGHNLSSNSMKPTMASS